jgi:ABC-type Fe3+-hydroxamate transport system substrate-binding protein
VIARVVSLVPSATETLFAWGIVPVAVTRWCGHPELPQVGGTKDPDVGAIRDLQPDLVVVCDEENRREDAEALVEAGIALHVLRIRSIDQVAPALAELADRLQVQPMPGLGGVVDRHASPRAGRGRRAFVPIWRERNKAGDVSYQTLNNDTYGASVLDALGLSNAFADHADRYPPARPDEVRALGVDVVIAPSEPYPFSSRHEKELSALAPVIFVDGQDLFWWGVRTPRALERLAAAVGDALGPGGSIGEVAQPNETKAPGDGRTTQARG